MIFINMKDLISKLLRENLENANQTEYVVFEITKPIGLMSMKYYFQARPKHELKTGRVYINKGSAGHKSISVKSIEVLKTFLIPSQEEEMNNYLNELRNKV
jgi:hypothetical protein